MTGEFEAMYFKAIIDFFEKTTSHIVMERSQDIAPTDFFEEIIKKIDKKEDKKLLLKN